MISPPNYYYCSLVELGDDVLIIVVLGDELLVVELCDELVPPKS
jgi:hypothetical protein